MRSARSPARCSSASGAEPDLAALFVTGPHTGALEDIARAVHAAARAAGADRRDRRVGGRWRPRGRGRRPGMSLWAGRLPRPASRGAPRGHADAPTGRMVSGLDPALAARASTLLLLPDPFSFPVDGFLAHLAEAHPHLSVIGGLASAARGPGGNRLVLDGSSCTDGAVGVLLDVDASPQAIVSQGCRPIGQPFIVTRAERHVLYELAGRPALERLLEIVEQLPPEDRALAARGLHCGIVIDEHKPDVRPGRLPDPRRAGRRPRRRGGGGRRRGAGRVPPCSSRCATRHRRTRTSPACSRPTRRRRRARVHLQRPRHAPVRRSRPRRRRRAADVLGPLPVAGMFCAGELGPVGGRNVLHGFTASVALFHD